MQNDCILIANARPMQYIAIAINFLSFALNFGIFSRIIKCEKFRIRKVWVMSHAPTRLHFTLIGREKMNQIVRLLRIFFPQNFKREKHEYENFRKRNFENTKMDFWLCKDNYHLSCQILYHTQFYFFTSRENNSVRKTNSNMKTF